MSEVNQDALGVEVREGDTVVTHGVGSKVRQTAGTRYSLGEAEVVKITPKGFNVKRPGQNTYSMFRRNHEVVKIQDGVVEFEYGIGWQDDPRPYIDGLNREQAETWLSDYRALHGKDIELYSVIRKARGTWQKV